MGYCNEHDRVFSGPECPDCGGDDSHSDTTQSTNPRQDQPSDSEQSELNPEDSIEKSVKDRIQDASEEIAVESEDGDIVVGEQQKSVDKTEHIERDNSTTVHEEVTTTHDNSTTVTDSTVNRSTIGGDDGSEDEKTDNKVYCIQCGEEISVKFSQCPVCGTKLD